MTTAFDTLKAEIVALLQDFGDEAGGGGAPAAMPAGLERALLKVQGLLMAAEVTDREAMTGTPIPPTSTIQRLNLEPGDILVLLDPGTLRREHVERFTTFIRKSLTESGVGEVPIIVLDGGRSLQVLKASPSLLQPREPLAFSKPDDTADLFPKAATEVRDVTRLAAVDLTGPELSAEIERVEAERKAFGADAGDHARMVELNHLRAEQDRRWQEANRPENQS